MTNGKRRGTNFAVNRCLSLKYCITSQWRRQLSSLIAINQQKSPAPHWVYIVSTRVTNKPSICPSVWAKVNWVITAQWRPVVRIEVERGVTISIGAILDPYAHPKFPKWWDFWHLQLSVEFRPNGGRSNRTLYWDVLGSHWSGFDWRPWIPYHVVHTNFALK